MGEETKDMRLTTVGELYPIGERQVGRWLQASCMILKVRGLSRNGRCRVSSIQNPEGDKGIDRQADADEEYNSRKG